MVGGGREKEDEEEEEVEMIETPKVNVMMEVKRRKKTLQESSEFEEVWD